MSIQTIGAFKHRYSIALPQFSSRVQASFLDMECTTRGIIGESSNCFCDISSKAPDIWPFTGDCPFSPIIAN